VKIESAHSACTHEQIHAKVNHRNETGRREEGGGRRKKERRGRGEEQREECSRER
jgi:hypothetical protein